MSNAMHVAKTGLNAQNTRMQVIANNLANVNTTGFKKIEPILNLFCIKLLRNLVLKHLVRQKQIQLFLLVLVLEL